MTTKIALDGVGGQGVRLIAGIMGSLLARMGKQVTVLFDYDSSVRGSMSDAFLIFDDEPIANPVVEEADIMLKLADKGHLRISGRKVVADLGLDVPGAEQIPFASLGSQNFGKELFGNMIALGRILRLAEIEFDDDAIRESLPRRYVEENVAAIRFGYDLTDDDIARLAAAAPPSRFQMNTAATAAGSPVERIGIVIREARPEDAGVIAEIWLASFKATYGFPPAHPDDDVRAWVADVLLPETDTWIAEEERGVANGFISIGEGSIEQLYVSPGWTGRGIGSRLVRLAQARRPAGLELWTFQVNDGARRFYERHGFRAVELTDGAGNEERQPDVRYVWP